jgi:hypothetical protein
MRRDATTLQTERSTALLSKSVIIGEVSPYDPPLSSCATNHAKILILKEAMLAIERTVSGARRHSRPNALERCQYPIPCSTP